MIIKKIELYTLEELSKKAQERAHEDYLREIEYFFLEEELQEVLSQELQKYGIESESNKIYYSLSYRQGDGAMFTGRFFWNDKVVTISHSGNYYHSYSKNIYIETKDGDSLEDENGVFEKIYQSICKKLEDAGYAYIESENAFDTFAENSKNNEWTYRENGSLELL